MVIHTFAGLVIKPSWCNRGLARWMEGRKVIDEITIVGEQ